MMAQTRVETYLDRFVFQQGPEGDRQRGCGEEAGRGHTNTESRQGIDCIENQDGMLGLHGGSEEGGRPQLRGIRVFHTLRNESASCIRMGIPPRLSRQGIFGIVQMVSSSDGKPRTLSFFGLVYAHVANVYHGFLENKARSIHPTLRF